MKTDEDFKSSLLHEYRHAKTYLAEKVSGIKISVPPLILEGNEGLFVAVTEMDAVGEELRSNLKLSASYRGDRCGYYFENYTAIWEKWNASPEFINSLKIKFLNRGC